MGNVMFMRKGEVHTAPIIPTVPLSTLMEGTVVMIEENGVKVPFYVAQQGYTCGWSNNTNRVLMVRKDCYDTRAWHSSDVNDYDNSAMDSWLTKTYAKLFSSDVQTAMGTTRITVCNGNGNGNTYGPYRKVFLLSATELGLSYDVGLAEGSKVPIASTLKKAYMDGASVTQWTRTPDVNGTTNAYYTSTSGGIKSGTCTTACGCRPSFTLPSSALVSEIPNADGSVNLRI